MVLDPASAPSDQIAQFRSDGVTASTGLRVPFFTDGFARAYGLPETRLRNMISEATPLREERPYAPFVGLREIRYSRPGLAPAVRCGSGPIRGVFRAPPMFGGGLLAVSGTGVFDVGSGASLGAIPGLDMARFAASRDDMVIVASGIAYSFTAGAFTAGTFAPITSPALPPVLDVAWLAGRFVYACVGSDTFYWSAINDPTRVDGLAFATAEASSDPIVALGVLGDQLMIFGALSVETWTAGGDANAPFQPTPGRGYQRGCAGRDTLSFCDNALFWVGDNRVVYRTGDSPRRISSNAIEDKLRQCQAIADCTAFTVTVEGHEFYVLNLPGLGSYAYDGSRVGAQAGAFGDSFGRGEWGEWASHGRGLFRGRCAAAVEGVAWLGDDQTSDLWTLQVGRYRDGDDPLVRIASAFIKVEEGTPRCLNLVLHGVMGVGNSAEPGARPVVELRWSDDQGRTFGDWRAASLGVQGAYRGRAVWRRLGQMRAPGRLVEVRVSDPVNAVFSHLELNAARPGH